MKKSVLLTIVASLVLIVGFSQDPKKYIVAIPGFQIASDARIPQQTITAIEQQVVDVFVKNKKFTVVERGQIGQLQNEIDLQKHESFMDGKGNISAQLKNTGANYLLTGMVSTLNYSSEQKEETKYDANQKKSVVVGYYTANYCTISFNLKLIDIATGQIVLSEVVTSKNSNGQGGGGSLLDLLSLSSSKVGAASPENAYNEALGQINYYVTSFVKKAFPNVLQIAEITERDRSNEAKTLLLVGDYVDYITEGQRLYVKLITETEVAGRKLVRKKKIGEVKVQKIEEGGFITVKVKSGESEITQAFEAKGRIEITEVE
jgi:curli biogenesis system outer membrane secretion channel CsgG